MLNLICERCGARIKLSSNEAIAYCEYCGAQYFLRETGSNESTADNLILRAFLFLEEENFTRADEYCEQVLDLDIKNSKAYLGKLMAELRVKKQDELADCEESFEDSHNYQNLIKFADDDLKNTVNNYLNTVKERIKNRERQKQYDLAQQKMNFAFDEAMYLEAASDFEAILDFKDSNDKAKQCRKEAKLRREKEEKQEKRNKKLLLFVGLPILLICIFLVVFFTSILPGRDYDHAAALLEQGRYDEAIVAFEKLGNYKDSELMASKALYEKQLGGLSAITVGNTVTFGSYEQDNDLLNGKEDIQWLVIAEEDGQYLLLSKYALENRNFNNSYSSTTWETCSLREWLNDKFYNTAFGGYHQEMITETKVEADKTPDCETDPGNDTRDKVFLLSGEEIDEYFEYKDERLLCEVTEYTIEQDIDVFDKYYTDGGNVCYWWLRSPGSDDTLVNYIRPDAIDSGSITNREREITGMYDTGISAIAKMGVRPAIWITIENNK